MHRLLLLAALATTALPAFAQSPTQPAGITPAQLGEIYCIGSLGDDMAPVRALLTEDFLSAIAQAEDDNTKWIATHAADEKPPLGDGLPWRELPDYADGCTAGAVTLDGNEGAVAINFTFADQPEANYTNSLRLERVTLQGDFVPRWRIINIDFSANDGGTMRQTLFEAFAF